MPPPRMQSIKHVPKKDIAVSGGIDFDNVKGTHQTGL